MTLSRPIFALWLLALTPASLHPESASTSGHREAVCADCHTAYASVGKPVEPVDFNRQCRECHGADTSRFYSTGLGFHTNTRIQCLTCHTFHSNSRLSIGEDQVEFSRTAADPQATCRACHGSERSIEALSPGHRRAAELYHTSLFTKSNISVTQSCLVCHGDGGGVLSTTLSQAAREAPRFESHGSHPVEISLRDRELAPGSRTIGANPAGLDLPQGRIECVTCHDLTAADNSFLAAGLDANELCRACHEIK